VTSQDSDQTLGPLRVDLLARIGAAVLSIQTTERALRLIITFVLQKSSTISAEQLEVTGQSFMLPDRLQASPTREPNANLEV
jgi:hypothetical protein